MKSLVNDLLKVADAIFNDCRQAYPTDAGFDRDIKTFTRISKTRGLGFFTLDLPHLDSILTNGLKVQRLRLEGPLSKRYSKRVQVPRLLSGLWMRVFDKQGCLLPEVDHTAVFFLRQLCCFGKKLQTQCSTPRLEKAIEDYIDVDRKLRAPSLEWESDTLDPDGIHPSLHFCDGLDVHDPLFPGFENSKPRASGFLLGRLQRICDRIAERFEFFDPVSYSEYRISADLGSGLKHGPGAVADLRSGSDKYQFPTWPAKLQRLFPIELFVHGAQWDSSLNHEVPSKLIAVPKTAKSPRLIASEPTCHMYTQQLIMTFMVDVIKYSPIGRFLDFSKQELSHDLVRRSSLDQSLATVDLSAASDRLSCWVVERMFRKAPRFLEHLHATRTRWTSVRSGEFMLKRKFASQGTAVTFPVQSLFFLACALAVSGNGLANVEGRRKNLVGKVRVFGDDIVIPVDGYADLKLLLETLDLKVNDEKSFFTGKFRESCGADFFDGHNVTPIKTTSLSSDRPEAVQSLIDYSNNLFSAGLWHASDTVRSMLSKWNKFIPIVSTVSGANGYTSFLGENYDHLRKRWNESLHRTEVRALVFKTKNPTKESVGNAALSRFFTTCSAGSRFSPSIEYLSGIPRSLMRVGWVGAHPADLV